MITINIRSDQKSDPTQLYLNRKEFLCNVISRQPIINKHRNLDKCNENCYDTNENEQYDMGNCFTKKLINLFKDTKSKYKSKTKWKSRKKK